ncbi:hypothetical protein ACHAPO_006428 [Fusarium lateritium]
MELPIYFATFAEEDPGKVTRIRVRHRVHQTNVLKVESIAVESSGVQEAAELGLRRTDGLSYEHEETFEIDGQGGERINRTITWWLDNMTVGLTIQTNRGRGHDFLGLIDKNQPPDGLKSSPEEPGNRTVVGFWTSMTTEEGFDILGLVLR